MDRICRPFFAIALCFGATAAASAQTPDPAPEEEASPPAAQLDRVYVIGRRDNLIGEANSASEGWLDLEDIERRPLLRPGDLVEYVPGMAATQHSGSGKANQYFLRGFNLDHGTDFSTFVDGMPVNLRTHGHGHGYTDLNFIIPEMIGGLHYRKGPYYADVGDFSSAGTVDFHIADRVDRGFLQLEAGAFGYGRAVAGDSVEVSDALLTWGIEAQTYDGPWKDISEDVRKRNALLRVSWPLGGGEAHAMLLGYENRWNSPDQIPERAVESGIIDRLGSIDTTLGGRSSRSSLSTGWTGRLFGAETTLGAYWIDYRLSLWSNFTYGLDDPPNGDQFRQFDRRQVSGFDVESVWSGDRWTLSAGLQARRDDIDRVGLSRTRDRRFVSSIRDDRVDERSLGLWVQALWRPSDRWRITLGARHDHYRFDVRALQPENDGRKSDGIASLKAGLAWNVNDALELYANAGQGFHSNDARGTTIRIDPLSGDPVEPVTPLVRTHGEEIGLRWYRPGYWQVTMALWRLALDSELLFVGDAGNTEASRPADRHGVEIGWSVFAGKRNQLALEASWTRARFSDADPAGSRIPGAVPLVVSAEWTAEWRNGWYSSLRARHLGPYPLIEDDSVSSDGSLLFNASLGKHWTHWTLELDLLNLFDSRDHDIDYYYASRLPGEPADGVEDLHFHAFEPRSLRLRLTRRF
ncbi:MAG: TonB-dependent receptor [Pseudomonadota bacterium]